MRSDVNKILTECYKEGRGRHYKFPRSTTAKLFDETGGKKGMHHVHDRAKKHGTKSFGENLAYLPRFLAANVGRKWNDIYAEICKNFDRRSTVNDHIFQHLFDYFVPAKEVVFVKNKPHRVDAYQTYPIYASSYRGYYVDPRSGVFKEGMKPKAGTLSYQEARARDMAAKELEHKRIISPLVEMHKREDGLWYVFTLKPVPVTKVVSYVFGQPYPRDYEGQQLWFKARKRFDDLTREGREREGKRVEKEIEFKKYDSFVPYGYKSSLVDKLYDRATRSYGPATHYYDSMHSTSKKELRAAGL